MVGKLPDGSFIAWYVQSYTVYPEGGVTGVTMG